MRVATVILIVLIAVLAWLVFAGRRWAWVLTLSVMAWTALSTITGLASEARTAGLAGFLQHPWNNLTLPTLNLKDARFGQIPLTVPEIRRLWAAHHTPAHSPHHHDDWSAWRRRHQACAQWYHQRRNLTIWDQFHEATG